LAHDSDKSTRCGLIEGFCSGLIIIYIAHGIRGPRASASLKADFMVAAPHNWLSAIASWRLFGRSKSEDAPKVGAYPVDYSEPTQEEIDAANGSCKELFKTGH
jgi:hypothetical protein